MLILFVGSSQSDVKNAELHFSKNAKDSLRTTLARIPGGKRFHLLLKSR